MINELDELEFFEEESTDKLGNNLLIVDSLNYAFKYKHRGTKSFAASFIRDMRSFSKSYSCKDVIILGDGGSSYRKGIYPEYKANRVYDEDGKEEFELFLEEYNNALNLMEYPILKYRGVEADDIAAYLTDNISDKYDNVWLLSTDRDWDLLLKHNVHRFSYINRREVTVDSFEGYYGYPPSMHISIKVLMGDTGDNIFGIKGIGAKRAYGLVKQYGSAYDIYASLPVAGKAKYIVELNKAKDLIDLNYRLMDLLETYNDAISSEIIKDIEEKIK